MTHRFKPSEKLQLVAEYKLHPSEPATHDEPGSGPEIEITEVYIEWCKITEDITPIISELERWTSLPIFENLQERILEEL